MKHRRASSSAAHLIAVGAPLVVYLLTLARHVTVTDSGELAAVAATLGIAHPPGYPLFTLVGWLLAQLPIGTVAFRVGLTSALAAACTSLVVFRTGLKIGSAAAAGRPRPSNESAQPDHSSDRGAPASRLPTAPGLSAFAALAGALLVAFSGTFWSQAVVVEVYALQSLLVALFLVACWRALQPEADPNRTWPAAGLAAGLALTNHLTGALLLPGLLVTLTVGVRRLRSGLARPAARTAFAFSLPLLLYLYLPLRSLAAPPVRWAHIDSLQAFLVHVTARQYHGLWGSRGLQLVELSRFFRRQLPAEATPLLVVLALAGLVAIARRRPAFAVVSTLVAGLTVLYNIGYPIHDIAVYYLPVLVVLGLWAAVGAVALAVLVERRHRSAGFLVATALCAACLVPLARHWRTNDRHADRLVACAVRDTLQPLEPDAVLLTNRSDTLSSPALYSQHVTGLRPDVVVLDYGRLAAPSFEATLSRIAPDLAAACRSELSATREIGIAAERGQSHDPADGRRRLAALRRSLVVAAVQRRPTYVTSDLYRHPMVSGYTLICEGLVARVAHQDTFVSIPLAAIEGPCARPGDLRRPLQRLIWDDYRVAMLNRAQYLRRHGLEDEAVAYHRRAVELTVEGGGDR